MRTLAANPFELFESEGFRLATRPAAGNRHADDAVAVDPDNISPRPAVTDEAEAGQGVAVGLDREANGRAIGRRGCVERQPQLHRPPE